MLQVDTKDHYSDMIDSYIFLKAQHRELFQWLALRDWADMALPHSTTGFPSS